MLKLLVTHAAAHSRSTEALKLTNMLPCFVVVVVGAPPRDLLSINTDVFNAVDLGDRPCPMEARNGTYKARSGTGYIEDKTVLEALRAVSLNISSWHSLLVNTMVSVDKPTLPALTAAEYCCLLSCRLFPCSTLSCFPFAALTPCVCPLSAVP